MRAAAYDGARTMTLRNLEATPPKPHEVQIAVSYVGLCGTDLHVFHGDMDARVTTPAILGHEMSGTIRTVGTAAADWAAGDHVTVMPLLWDGTCPACRAGHQHVCQNLDFVGIDSPGALQELWNVDARLLIALPPTLSLHHAALTEPVAVAVHDVRRGEVSYGDRVVVVGGGPIGVLIATVAREFGAVVAVAEPDANRRRTIESLGFDTFDPIATDQVAWVETWSNGVGADVVFEVSGAPSAVLAAAGLVRVRGRLVIVAIHSQPSPVDLHRVFWRELTIVGARVYQPQDCETAAHLLAQGVIPADAIISRTVTLNEVGDALVDLDKGEAMKILVDVQNGAARP